MVRLDPLALRYIYRCGFFVKFVCMIGAHIVLASLPVYVGGDFLGDNFVVFC